MQEYTVKRRHLGDKLYEEGDTRTGNPSDLKELVDRGVLVIKAEKPVENKAVKAPRNKAEK